MNGRGATETSTRDETQPAPGEQPLTYTRQASRVGRRLDRAELLVMRFRWALLPFISGLLIGALVGATNPASSFATPCSGVPYNTAARSNDGSLEHRGDKADNDGIWVPATGTSVSCIRVSSLIITHNGFADQVEVGWFDASGNLREQRVIGCRILSRERKQSLVGRLTVSLARLRPLIFAQTNPWAGGHSLRGCGHDGDSHSHIVVIKSNVACHQC